MSDTTETYQDFTLWVTPRPGLTETEQAAYQRRLEDYIQGQDIFMRGDHLRGVLWSPERSMTAEDQVTLINWLIDDPAVSMFSLSPLNDTVDDYALREEGYLDVQPWDLGLIGLTVVYRMGRVDAKTYLQILGGFVRPAPH